MPTIAILISDETKDAIERYARQKGHVHKISCRINWSSAGNELLCQALEEQTYDQNADLICCENMEELSEQFA